MNIEGEPINSIRKRVNEERIQRWFRVEVEDQKLTQDTSDLQDRREWNRRIVQNPSLAREYNEQRGLDSRKSNKGTR